MTALDVLLPYFLFCVVMTGSPGPNNAMVLASGVRVGVRRSAPLVLGIAIGVALQLTAIGLGLSVVFDAMPALHQVLRFGGAAYIIWLAYHVAMSGPIRDGADDKASLGFWGGVLFQWINPKTWTIATSAMAAYIPRGNSLQDVAIAALVLSFVAFPCVGSWAVFGNALRRFLADPAKARWFNGATAALLLASTIPILLNSH